MDPLGACPLTTKRQYRGGEGLFEACSRVGRFAVVKAGNVEILDESGETPEGSS